MNQFTFTDEELLCLQVCLQNAPIPYDIEMKKNKNRCREKNRITTSSRTQR